MSEQVESVEFRSLREAIWESELIGGNTKLLALRLVEHWPRMHPGMQFLARKMGVSERTVRDCMRELEAKGIIKTHRRPNKTSVYAFLDANGDAIRIPSLGTSLGVVPPPDRSGPADSAPLPDRQILPHGPADLAPPGGQNLPPKPSRKHSIKRRGEGAWGVGEKPTPLFFDLTSWEIPSAWVSEWTQRQLQPELLEGRVLRLRGLADSGRISAFRGGLTGPGRGVYLRGCFKEWLAFESINARKADSRAAFGSSGADRGGGVPWAPNQATRDFGAKWKIDVDALANAFVASGGAARAGVRAGEIFAKKISELAAPRMQAAAFAKTRQRSNSHQVMQA
jgi:hypothetical protein